MFRIMQIPANEGQTYEWGGAIRRDWFRDETGEVREFSTVEQANSEAMDLEDQNKGFYRAFEVEFAA